MTKLHSHLDSPGWLAWPGRLSDALFILDNARQALALLPVDSLRTLTMQIRPQDDVKVAVYTEQMTAPDADNLQDLIGALCLGLALLMTFWLNTSV